MKQCLIYKKQVQGFKIVKETIRVVEKAAASHIHILKKQVAALENYKKEIGIVLDRISKIGEAKTHPLLKRKTAGKRELLVLGGDRGIVGGLYHQLVNEFLKKRGDYQDIWVLGKRTKEHLEAEGIKTKEFFSNGGDILNLENLQRMSERFLDSFQNKEWQILDILYPQFISLGEQRPRFVRFLPFDFKQEGFSEAGGDNVRTLENIGFAPGEKPGLPIFEPTRKSLFRTLFGKYISVFFLQIVLEAKLSEFSARTVTAEDAVSKTEKIVQGLTLAFLKERKRSLTQKQLESFNVLKTL